MSECPKCGYDRRHGDLECPKCGIVYVKYEKYIEELKQKQEIAKPEGKKDIVGDSLRFSEYPLKAKLAIILPLVNIVLYILLIIIELEYSTYGWNGDDYLFFYCVVIFGGLIYSFIFMRRTWAVHLFVFLYFFR